MAVGSTQGEIQNIPFGFFDLSLFIANSNASAKLPPAESPARIILGFLLFLKEKSMLS